MFVEMISFFKVAPSAGEQKKNKLAEQGWVGVGQNSRLNSVIGVPAAARRSLSVGDL